MIVIIAGGGTGGHIYPGLAIADALQKINPQSEISFVGTKAGLESKIVTKTKYQIDFIQSGQLNLSGQVLKKIQTLLKIPVGFIQALFVLLKRQPDFVLGVGGYASAPFVFMAAICGFKTAIWEPNAHPGMANRILSRFVEKSYLVFKDGEKYLKSKKNLIYGMPLRSEITEGAGSRLAQAGKKFTLLCFGGSQGSLFLNEKLSQFILNHPDIHSKIRVVHQTGARDFENIKAKYKDLACVEVHDYIYDMPSFLQAADLLFCRGGASTIAEAAAYGVVPVVVPLPAADNHQQRNAEALVANDAGYMILQNEFNDDHFKKIVYSALENTSSLNEKSKNIKKMSSLSAATDIAQDIFNEIGLS